MILAAFYAGSVKNVVVGMIGFLAFFVAGITLIVEGIKKRKRDAD